MVNKPKQIKTIFDFILAFQTYMIGNHGMKNKNRAKNKRK